MREKRAAESSSSFLLLLLCYLSPSIVPCPSPRSCSLFSSDRAAIEVLERCSREGGSWRVGCRWRRIYYSSLSLRGHCRSVVKVLFLGFFPSILMVQSHDEKHIKCSSPLSLCYHRITSVEQPKHTMRDRLAKIQFDECLFHLSRHVRRYGT